MTYAALARRYRPRRFQEVVGQDHAVKALAHALDTGRLHPALLLTGTRGVGKTTLARLLAKGLNCETGVTSNPCNVCSACTEIDAGRFVDLLEIDAASHTGVDNIRELIENAQYLPARGRFKVYLIDEVHMLSRSAFNALLKTLEEPPAHVKFILATTDPQKLPVTVLSRCLRFPLKRLSASLIGRQLATVLAAEAVVADPEALRLIARAADGSVRDALSLTDQAIAYGGGEVALAPVEDMLGLTGRQALTDALLAVAAGDGVALVEAFRRLEDQGADHASLLDETCGALQRAALRQALPGAASVDGTGSPDDDDAGLPARLAAGCAPEELQLHYQIAILARRDLPHTPEPRMAFEMALLRMHAFRLEALAGVVAPTSTGRGDASGAGDDSRRGGGPPPRPPGPGPRGIDDGASRGDALSGLAAAKARAVSGAAGPGASPRPLPPPTPPLPTEPPPWSRLDAVPVPVLTATAAVVVPAPAPAPVPVSPPVSPPPAAPPSGDGTPPWHDLIETLGLEGLARQMARHCAWEGFSVDGTTLVLTLDQTQGRLLRPERREALEQALSGYFRRPRMHLEIRLGEVETASAAHTQRAVETRRREALVEAIASDPVVEAFARHFGARVRPGSASPVR